MSGCPDIGPSALHRTQTISRRISGFSDMSVSLFVCSSGCPNQSLFRYVPMSVQPRSTELRWSLALLGRISRFSVDLHVSLFRWFVRISASIHRWGATALYRKNLRICLSVCESRCPNAPRILSLESLFSRVSHFFLHSAPGIIYAPSHHRRSLQFTAHH